MDDQWLRRLPFRLSLARNAMACLHRMRGLEQAVRLGFDAEALHDYRVALRRLRALLWSVRSELPAPWYQRVRKRLKALAAPTVPVRDLDVLLARAEQWNSAAEGDVLEPVLAMLYRRRQTAHEQLEQWLRTADYEALITAVGADLLALLSIDEALFHARTRRSVNIAYTRLQRHFARRLKRIGANCSDAQFHRLRVLCKNVRYFGESFAPVLGKSTSRCSKRIKVVQNALGAINDSSVQLALIDSLKDDVIGETMIDSRAWYRLGMISAELSADLRRRRKKFLRGQAGLLQCL